MMAPCGPSMGRVALMPTCAQSGAAPLICRRPVATPTRVARVDQAVAELGTPRLPLVSAPSPRHKPPAHVIGSRRVLCRSQDYVCANSDEGVLRLPPRMELKPPQITSVFGYPRNFTELYFLGRVIGAGSFGVVRECLEASTGRRYAVKTIGKVPLRGPATPRYLLKLRTEVEIMQQLGYSLDAVNLKDVFEDDQAIHLVMELCEGGALLDRIEAGRYSEAYIARIARSILRFISQCHAKGIIYRDVKPDNFLFLSTEPDSPLKATDFGLSIRHWPDEPKLTSRSGTPAYMAPELVMQLYDEKADVWSVGMLLYQLLTGRFPFWEDVRNQTLSEVWRAIMTQDVCWSASELEQLSPSALSFLQHLLQRDPAARPSAQGALEHPWLQDEGSAPDLPLCGSVVQRLQRFSTYGSLKQVVLRLIVEEVGQQGPGGAMHSHVSDLEVLFRQLDTDANGSVSMDELALGLRAQGYVLADHELENLLRKVDANQDGQVDLPEFLATMIDWNKVASKDGGWQKYLDLAFQKLDEDGDGFISLDELLLRLPDVVGDAREAEAERVAEAKAMLREADTNGDGRISREEFNALLQDSHTPDSLSFYDDRLAKHMGSWTGGPGPAPTRLNSGGVPVKANQ